MDDLDKPGQSGTANAVKPVIVKNGRYKGAQATIYGTDVELFNKGVIALSRENSQEALDYVKRITSDLLPLMNKVYYAQIEGTNIFLNEVELNEAKKEPKKEKKEGKKYVKQGSKHDKNEVKHKH